jgi:hypothetical protein
VLLEAPTVDTDSTGDPIQPAFRVIDGYNPRSVVIPTPASEASRPVVAPVRGLLGGSSAFVDSSATRWRSGGQTYAAQHAFIDESTAQTVAGTRGGTLMKPAKPSMTRASTRPEARLRRGAGLCIGRRTSKRSARARGSNLSS